MALAVHLKGFGLALLLDFEEDRPKFHPDLVEGAEQDLPYSRSKTTCSSSATPLIVKTPAGRRP